MSPLTGAPASATARRPSGLIHAPPRMIRPLRAAGLLACAWLLPIAAQALRADWLLLIVALLGTGSVLRAG